MEIDQKIINLFIKYKTESVDQKLDWDQNYWAQIAAVIIKSMKSETLEKLIEKIDNFREAMEEESDNSSDRMYKLEMEMKKPKISVNKLGKK